jgi:hypothetical protein
MGTDRDNRRSYAKIQRELVILVMNTMVKDDPALMMIVFILNGNATQEEPKACPPPSLPYDDIRG